MSIKLSTFFSSKVFRRFLATTIFVVATSIFLVAPKSVFASTGLDSGAVFFSGTLSGNSLYTDDLPSTPVIYQLVAEQGLDCSGTAGGVFPSGKHTSGQVAWSDYYTGTISGRNVLIDLTSIFDSQWSEASLCGASGNDGVGSYDLGYNSWINFSKVGGVWQIVGTVANVTRIVSIFPTQGYVFATSSLNENGRVGATTTMAVSYYINADDLTWFTGMRVDIKNQDINYTTWGANLSNYTFAHTCSDPLLGVSTTTLPYETIADLDCSAGFHSWTQTIWLPLGGYAIHVKMLGTFLGAVNPIKSILNSINESQDTTLPYAQYCEYTVIQDTALSAIQKSTNNELESILNGTTSSSTVSVADCNVLYGFDFGKCMSFAILPSSAQSQAFYDEISYNVLSKFPFGYVWNFYQLLTSSSTVALPLIDAMVPNGVAGAGAHIHLALEPTTLAYIYNATSSQFNNISAPSTATLRSQVEYYWDIIIYLSVAMYLIGRILGSHVIGNIWGEEVSGVRSQITRMRGKGGKDISYQLDQEERWAAARDVIRGCEHFRN